MVRRINYFPLDVAGFDGVSGISKYISSLPIAIADSGEIDVRAVHRLAHASMSKNRKPDWVECGSTASAVEFRALSSSYCCCAFLFLVPPGSGIGPACGLGLVLFP